MSALSKSSAIILIALLVAVVYSLTPLIVGAVAITAAVDDVFSVAEGGSLTVATPGVLANDVIGDGALVITQVNLVDAPVVPGTFSLGNDGSVSFTPTDVNYSGTVTFTYTITDDQSFTSAPATVIMNVTPVNDAPTATDQSFSVTMPAALSDTLTATDIDSGDTLSYATTSNPAHGTLTLDSATGHFVYTPTSDGDDVFTWQVTDAAASTSVATTTIHVAAAPVVVPPAPEEEKKPANGPISDMGPFFGTITNFSGIVLGASTTTDASTTLPELPAGCTPLLSGFMRKTNMDNSADDVKKLQTFLNTSINAALPVTGDFSTDTDTAVRMFQQKHADQILAPWGITSPTGFVYLTTQRWINLMSCDSLDIPMPKLVPFHQ